MALKYFKNNEYPNAFTLAEVLITLVIIGVIAAMVVPTIIQNSNESATVSKVKKGLSTLGQAKILAETQNGPIADWDFEGSATSANAQKIWNYLRPHIQVAQYCGSSVNCYQPGTMYYLSGSTLGTNYPGSAIYHKFVLSDGGVMWFKVLTPKCTSTEGNSTNGCVGVFYDVNGDKAPNTVGRDIFSYIITQEGVVPSMTTQCRKNSTGWGCASYIIKNSNMKYLH